MVFFQLSSQRDTVKKHKSDCITPLHMMALSFRVKAMKPCMTHCPSLISFPSAYRFTHSVLALLAFLKHGRHALGSSYLLFSLSETLLPESTVNSLQIFTQMSPSSFPCDHLWSSCLNLHPACPISILTYICLERGEMNNIKTHHNTC